ncbi:trypsin-like peptidase domain-containing protein [Nocardia sp. NPDC057440]|uniref:trypsin-like peptidase domain-containing protein n=1 Tax=Nocardia sp. NPDC057440 TaxID=3346134 RepID=UPI00366D2F73
MDISPEMLAAKEALAAVLEGALPFLPGVVGVDIGYREEGLELTDDVVIRVLVRDLNDVPAALPGLLSPVEAAVTLVERDLDPLIDTAARNPLIGGISIAAAHGAAEIQAGAGTFGGLATDTLFPGPRVGVTCAHVIASSDVEVHQGDPIRQPEAPLPGSRRIGQLFRFSEPEDIAVFTVDQPALANIVDIGTYSGMARANGDDIVRKRGRTTELTVGRVTSTGLQILGRGTRAIGYEIRRRPTDPPSFCDRGDSGSLVINEQNQVVGLLTQRGLPNPGAPGFLSGFAVQIVDAAAAVGITF